MSVRIGKVSQPIAGYTGGKSWRRMVREQGRLVDATFHLVGMTAAFGGPTLIHWKRVA